MSHPHGDPHWIPAQPPPPAAEFEPAPVMAAPAVSAQTAQFPVGMAAVPTQPAAPAYETPVSAPGYSGYPTAYAPPVPPKKGRAATIVLSLVTGVLVLATAGLGVLYFLEADARADTEKQLADTTTALTTEQAKTKDLDGQLSAAKAEAAKLDQDLTGAKAKTDEVSKERDAMAACFQAIENYGRSRTTANAKAADAKCDEASKYW